MANELNVKNSPLFHTITCPGGYSLLNHVGCKKILEYLSKNKNKITENEIENYITFICRPNGSIYKNECIRVGNNHRVQHINNLIEMSILTDFTKKKNIQTIIKYINTNELEKIIKNQILYFKEMVSELFTSQYFICELILYNHNSCLNLIFNDCSNLINCIKAVEYYSIGCRVLNESKKESKNNLIVILIRKIKKEIDQIKNEDDDINKKKEENGDDELLQSKKLEFFKTIENDLEKLLKQNCENIKDGLLYQLLIEIQKIATKKRFSEYLGIIIHHLMFNEKIEKIKEIIPFYNKESLKECINYNFDLIIPHRYNGRGRDCTSNIKDGIIGNVNSSKLVQALIFYGLDINKSNLIKILSTYDYIEDIDKYGIDIDNDIMKICSIKKFYPYKYDNKPSKDIIEIECTYGKNLKNISHIKDLGGEFTTQSLINACKIKGNISIIKFIVEKCNVTVNQSCIKEFEKSINFDGLSYILKKYDDTKEKKIEEKVKELNKNSVMIIEEKKLNYKLNDELNVYKLKKKVVEFLKIQDKKYSFHEISEIFFNYLIKNDLTIGKYFVVDVKLSKLLKLNQCIIIGLDSVNAILSYFIKEKYIMEEKINKKNKLENNLEKMEETITLTETINIDENKKINIDKDAT